MKASVKQMRGPGMNLGLKKPRKKPPEPKPYTPSRALKAASKADPGSYLPDEGKAGKKSPKAPQKSGAPGKKLPFKF
jgi:hypothetical protein